MAVTQGCVRTALQLILMKKIPSKIVNSKFGPMIINGNDLYIGRSLEVHGVWAGDDINVIAQICAFLLQSKPQIRVYDVGSNIGTHSIALATIFGDSISIRAFEAQRQVYYMLCGNVAVNGLINIECEHLAVSDGTIDFINIDLPDYGSANNFGGVELMTPNVSDNQNMVKQGQEIVECVTIDRFDEPVDFIKMDIEGMEHLALAGAVKTLASRPVCFVEMTKTDQAQVKKIFNRAGYRAYAYKQEDWIFVPDESSLHLVGLETVSLV